MHASSSAIAFLDRDFFVAAAAGFRAVHVQGFAACRSLQGFFVLGLKPGWLVQTILLIPKRESIAEVK
jgi:hypothetical protein